MNGKCQLFLLSALLSSCSSLPKSAARTDFDFKSIRTVELRAKENISPLISRELLLAGIKPIDESLGFSDVDASLKVSITRQSPDKRYIVRTTKKTIAQQTSSSKSGDTTLTTVQFEEDPGHAPIEVSGGYAYTQSVWGTGSDSARLIATYAQVTLSGELISPKTGEILWAGSYSYEGIDLETALEGAIRGLVQSLPLK